MDISEPAVPVSPDTGREALAAAWSQAVEAALELRHPDWERVIGPREAVGIALAILLPAAASTRAAALSLSPERATAGEGRAGRVRIDGAGMPYAEVTYSEATPATNRDEWLPMTRRHLVEPPDWNTCIREGCRDRKYPWGDTTCHGAALPAAAAPAVPGVGDAPDGDLRRRLHGPACCHEKVERVEALANEWQSATDLPDSTRAAVRICADRLRAALDPPSPPGCTRSMRCPVHPHHGCVPGLGPS